MKEPGWIYKMDRIGDVKNNRQGISSQPIIVKFKSYENRTKFYRGRKDIREAVGVSLDLTKTRLGILTEARKLIVDAADTKFVYADINCQLRIFTEQGKHIPFNSLADLSNRIAEMQS